jgi:metal-responsive CopG/Arc/MetJ family transcriptional regulator
MDCGIYSTLMETIQVVLDGKLLKAADQAARKLKLNRSALFRDALRAHLKKLDLLEKEKREREGYIRYPDSLDESSAWDKVADWPED